MASSPAAPSDPERQVVQRWQDSAGHWQRLLERQPPASRAITNPAIEQAVLAKSPRTVLDVGCGEGWLSRSLASQGIEMTGVDAVAPLLSTARKHDPYSHYLCLEYDDLPGPLEGRQFDVVVCNFALFGDQSVHRLVASLLTLLPANGHLLIQTLHPLSACQGDYREGWRDSQWQGLDHESQTMGEAPPWYFRPLSSWIALLQKHGRLVTMDEPLDPQTRQPLSVLFHVTPATQQDRNNA